MLGVGLTLHSMMDGVAVASNVMTDVDSVSPGANAWPGFGGFLAVFLHKPLDSLTIVSVMAAGGWSVRRQWLVNTAFAAAFPIATVAAVAAFSLGNQVPGSTPSGLLVGAALAFSAGAFLCVALADLLPEVRFHTHDRLKLSIALLAGVGLSLALSLFHYHGEAGGEHHDGVEHNDHAGHDHP